MKTQNKLCLSLLATLSLVAGSASAAGAHDEEEVPPPGLPMETNGYRPAPAFYYEDIVFPACGTTITLRAGDVQGLYEKIQEKQDGSLVIKVRGEITTDVIAEPGGNLPYGGFIDELDTSGPVKTYLSSDEPTIVEKYGAPSVFYPLGETDAAALAAAGLPEFGYFESGKVVFRTLFAEVEGGFGAVSTEVISNTKDVVDLCQALKESAGHSY
jgi:hypothetical protein